MTATADLTDPITDEDLDWAIALLKLRGIDESRRAYLKSLTTVDVSACPGSGKTTLVVAKLAILARKWKSATRGICVLSHTNVAREEISRRLGNTEVGQRLLMYPHFIDTIHGFVNRFLATPWLISAGYRLAAIDDEMTTRVRRRALDLREYRTLERYLEKSQVITFEKLRLGSANFASPLSGTSFPSGPHTNMYKYASAAMQYAAEQGYFCYDEIFLLGESLLAQRPDLPSTLQSRFPVILIDEMQDTSEQQSAFLRKLFPRDEVAICVQRVGDPNQTIFEGASGPLADTFPDAIRRVDISDSFRFDASIASLANPLAHRAVQPAGLKGARSHQGAPQGYAHTVFVFPDDDASGVLAAYGRHVVEALPGSVISSGSVTAVGAVHKPAPDVGPGHEHFPKSVSHYWHEYQLGAERLTHRPATLAEAFVAARKLASSGGPLHRGVDGVAAAISYLANLQAGSSQIKASSRQHLLLEKRLAARGDARAIYRDLLARYLIDREPLNPARWNELQPRLRMLGAAIGNGDAQAIAATDYLAWPDALAPTAIDDKTPTLAAAANCYRYVSTAGCVDIHLGSIHKTKGQTHLATLLLETFNRTHFLDALMPWMLGNHANGAKCTSRAAVQRLMQAYVAMTRPTHLLCLAIRASSLDSGKGAAANTQRLIERGWHVQNLAQ
ncbi:UvrD-helicase domain-containing protein [Ramlibacter tataouinensis]|uniref:UvrD-helicase domain-containing protein n=1 Tax=Ramlibacter tataouinensis TaxID=94132 RepID=UPI0022F3DB4D|nr:UvrD-helicase domain-containing protein [Ramlibacter tataouinensis]WBY03976.1 UvrD-helicase domain-containing protein [Ramlibacter tataouinensis]